MSISIHLETKNQITELGQRIVNDWAKKIKEEIGVKASSMPLFKVLITDRSISEGENLQNLNLVIIVEKQKNSSLLLALSGQLSTFGQKQKQFFPVHMAEVAIANCIAISIIQFYLDFINNSGTIQGGKLAILHRLNYIDCLKYYGAFNITAKAQGLIQNKRGGNFLDGGAPFYAIYPTKQGLLAIGNLQPKFFTQMVVQMGLQKTQQQFCLQNQINTDAWPKMRSIFQQKLMEKTAEEWQLIMSKKDTCVTCVKDFEKIQQSFLHPYLIKPKL